MVGLNQSFRKVFVATNPTLITAGSTNTLALGRIGLYNADTYAAVAAPVVSTTPRLIIAQGTPDQSTLPKGAGIRNETDKTKVIVGRKITGWRGKKANAGQVGIITVGYDGTDTTKTLTGKCDETKYLYIRLTGKPIEDLYPGGTIKMYAVTGPCCDTCGDNCADIASPYFRDAFYDLITQDLIIAGIPFTNYVQVTKTDGTNEDDVDVYGLQFTSAFVERTSNACYFDLFPYNADPIHIEISSYDPDWHDSPCTDDYPVTVIQEVTYPNGSGEFVMRLEAESKMWDYRYYSRDLATRQAEGTVLITDPTLDYDEFTLEYSVDYKVLGWSDVYTDTYQVHVFFPTTTGDPFETAINGYVASAGVGLPAVNLN